MVTQAHNGSEIEEGSWSFGDLKLCFPIPPHTPYGVSFHVPEWDHTVRMMDEDMDIIKKIEYGYPRIFFNHFVKKLNQAISEHFKITTEFQCFNFPSKRVAEDCKDYLERHAESPQQRDDLKNVRLEFLSLETPECELKIRLYPVIFSPSLEVLVFTFARNTGETLSTRLAVQALTILKYDLDDICARVISGDKFKKESRESQYNNKANSAHLTYHSVHLEKGGFPCPGNEDQTKATIKRRVGENLGIKDLDDIYLFPTGMSAIYNSLRLSLASFENHKSVCFGFPYKDTKKVLSQFGPGCHFYGMGEAEDIDSLRKLLEEEKILMLICEFPTNPLLKSPDLVQLKKLSVEHDFLLIVDDTLANLINLEGISEVADIIVTSLTKIFSGYSDVMGGSKHYSLLKERMEEVYEDNVWYEDALILEKNSRNARERAYKANEISEKLADFLTAFPKVKQVHYPKYTTPALYNRYKEFTRGGYGSLLSIEFHTPDQAITFFDSLDVAKGPSLGTNFTLAMPYVILAHSHELDEVAKYGVNSHLVRISVGLEGFDELRQTFLKALDNVPDI